MNFIDLFAGAGGLSEGFMRERFNPIVHVEMDKDACDTLKTRLAFHHLSRIKQLDFYYDCLQKNNRTELWETLPQDWLLSVINERISGKTLPDIFRQIDQLRDSKKIDLIIGGPPCQAYSVVGRSRDPKKMKWDRRNYLFRYYGEFLKRYKPKYFVFENVRGLLSAGNQKYFKEMMRLFSEVGYSTDYKVLNAEDFGVLQKRRRVFIIGRKGKRKFHFPELVAIPNNWQTKEDLFYDLPSLKPGQELSDAKYTQPINDYLRQTEIRNGVDFVTQHMTRQHNERDLEIYSIAIHEWLQNGKRLKYTDLPKRLQTHNNTRSFLDRFKVVNPGGHSHTMVAHISKDGHYYIYPDQKQVRSISVREAARIQSFPDDYFFEGGRTAAFRQIGNAVPPLMAHAIAQAIADIY